MDTEEIRPQVGPQTDFLASTADIVVYGGAAGGGKSYALLLECLRHHTNPRFGAVIFRKLSPQITQEGGLWDTAGEMFPITGAVPRVGDLDYRWPGGACVSFRHLQHEATKYAWQGSQIPMIGFDELTHFSESQFFYLLSRNRSTCGVRPYVRATTNPDAASWVKKFLGPWVNRKHPLYPTPSGTVLYFIRDKGELVYARTREAIAERYPKARPKTLSFIRASIFDNPALLQKDPDYLANLEAQTTVERARLLDGDWDVANEGLVYPDFGTIVVEPEHWPADLVGTPIGGIDWGFRNPFAALCGVVDRDDVIWLDWERYEQRQTLTQHSEAMPRNGARWWADPAGADQTAEMRLADHDVVPSTHIGKDPIKTGIGAITERIRLRSLWVKGTCGNLIDEAGKYQYGPDGEKPLDRFNHALGALRYLVTGHDRGRIARDEDPGESEAQRSVRVAEALAEREAAETAHYDVDNQIWWER